MWTLGLKTGLKENKSDLSFRVSVTHLLLCAVAPQTDLRHVQADLREQNKEINRPQTLQVLYYIEIIRVVILGSYNNI